MTSDCTRRHVLNAWLWGLDERCHAARQLGPWDHTTRCYHRCPLPEAAAQQLPGPCFESAAGKLTRLPARRCLSGCTPSWFISASNTLAVKRMSAQDRKSWISSTSRAPGFVPEEAFVCASLCVFAWLRICVCMCMYQGTTLQWLSLSGWVAKGKKAVCASHLIIILVSGKEQDVSSLVLRTALAEAMGSCKAAVGRTGDHPPSLVAYKASRLLQSLRAAMPPATRWWCR